MKKDLMNFILFKSNLFTSNCFKIFPSLFDVRLIFTFKNRVHSSKIVTFSFEIYSKHFSVNQHNHNHREPKTSHSVNSMMLASIQVKHRLNNEISWCPKGKSNNIVMGSPMKEVGASSIWSIVYNFVLNDWSWFT